jgi:4-hydroxy-3-methylbut-2-enyl diphosphate reductase
MGEAPEAMMLIESVEDVDKIDLPSDTKVAYLTQTTLSVDDANRIIARLRAKFPNLHNPPKDDICYATQNRQEAVRILSEDANVCLVLGSKNSSNSQRLREIASDLHVNSHLIDGPGDIDLEWFSAGDTVLITAGASAPETVVQQCIDLLIEKFDASVEPRVIREEEVHFPLPKVLRPLQESN